MADKKLSIYYRYWIYSKEEADRMMKISKTLSGKKPELGKVFTDNGVMKYYTSIVADLSQVQVPDAQIVMQGDIRHINYKSPEIY